MPESHTELYLHLVWATAQRQPFLAGQVRTEVYRCIHAECLKLGAEVVALNGTENHVHLLVRVPTALSVAALAKQTKGASSHLVRHNGTREGFQWQEGYSAFTVSRWDVPKVRDYVDKQEEHHANKTYKLLLEPD